MKGRKAIGLAVLLILIAVSLFALYQWKGKDFRWDLFTAALVNVDRTWFLAALTLLAITYIGRAVRWRVMMLPICPHPSIWRILSATVVGFTAIVILGRAGEAVRPYLIAKSERVPVASQLATWLLERIYDLLFVVLIFGLSLTQIDVNTVHVGPGLSWVLRMGGWVMGGLGLVCIAILITVGAFSDFARQRISSGLSVLPEKLRNRLEGVLHAFVGGMRSTGSRTFVSQLIGLTAIEWFLIVLTNYCLFQSLRETAHLSLIDNMIFLGFIAFGSVVQVPGIGGGMQVASVLVLTEMFGLPFEAATGVSLIIWLTNYVAVVPFGLILALTQGLNWKTVKSMDTENPVETKA